MNQLFKSLYTEVITNTNRPNLVAETKSAIVAATREFHNRGRFKADVREVILTSTNGGQTVFRFNLPEDRLIREILNVAPITPLGLKGASLPQTDPFTKQVCGSWYSWLNNVITIGVSHPANTFALSFLSFPDVSEANYTSWIASKYPHYITDAATFRVLVLTGNTQQASIYKNLVGEARIPGTHIFNLLRENEEVQ